MIDYNLAAKTYDNTRKISDNTIMLFHEKIKFDKEKNILDFGCGTGNYLNEIQKKFSCNCFGVDPSREMRNIAIKKNQYICVKEGNHKNLPYGSDFFDFIFMVDVIHHIPDLNQMFDELSRILKNNKMVCIVTESYSQIENRFYNKYFPSLIENEKKRYPDIDFIISCASKSLLKLDELQEVNNPKLTTVSESFIKLVEEKGFSMFGQLSEDEYIKGLKDLKKECGKKTNSIGSGETFIWLEKQ